VCVCVCVCVCARVCAFMCVNVCMFALPKEVPNVRASVYVENGRCHIKCFTLGGRKSSCIKSFTMMEPFCTIDAGGVGCEGSSQARCWPNSGMLCSGQSPQARVGHPHMKPNKRALVWKAVFTQPSRIAHTHDSITNQ
jgi:hypothetical protein